MKIHLKKYQNIIRLNIHDFRKLTFSIVDDDKPKPVVMCFTQGMSKKNSLK